MGQHDIDTECALRLNPLICRVLLHDPMGQQGAIMDDPAFFYGLQPAEFGSSRLVGRSVWNTQWKLVIPAYGLLNDEQTGLTRFAATVDDIKLFFRTYSHSGN